MKTLLFISFLTTFYVFAQRDPRPKDQANVFWNGAYSLYSLSSDEEIKPNSSGKYEFWGTTNENPQPIQYSLMKGNTLYVYKFISYSECLNSCNEIRKSKGLALLQTNQVSVEQISNTKPTTNLKSVVIGTQTWTTENLNVSTFRNGDPIPEAKTKEEWKKADGKRVPAWCNYNFEAKNGEKYGKLYNWYAVNDPRGLAPFGFHVSSANEWGDLFEFLYTGTEGGQEAAFPKMKMAPIYEMQTSYREIGGYKETKQCTHCSYWTEKQKEYNYCQVCRNDRRVYTGRYIPKETKKETKKVNVGWDGNNSSGFSAFPGGSCTDYGHDGYSSTSWWSTTGNWNSQEEDGYAVSYLLPNGNDYHDFSYVKDKGHGFYVRCIKD